MYYFNRFQMDYEAAKAVDELVQLVNDFPFAGDDWELATKTRVALASGYYRIASGDVYAVVDHGSYNPSFDSNILTAVEFSCGTRIEVETIFG